MTNNFLAGGQDGWTTFADGTNRWDTYYDMQEGFVEYIKMLEVIDAEDVPMDRIIHLDKVLTILHTNDSHGIWPETDYYGTAEGFAFLASHIKAERAKNPNYCYWMLATPSRATPSRNTSAMPHPIPSRAG